MLAEAESELLVLCARRRLTEGLTIKAEAILRGPLDWEALQAAAWRHGIAPLLFRHLSLLQSNNAAIPARVMHQLRQAYVRSTFRSRIHFQALSLLLTDFGKERITTALLKGAALATRVYDDPALRPFADLDLLVQEHQIDRAKEVLNHAGYELAPDLLSERFNRKYHINLPFVRRQPVPIHLELHWRLTDSFNPIRFDEAEVFRNLREIETPAGTAHALGAEDELVYLAAHLDNHGYLNRSILDQGAPWLFPVQELSGNRLIWFTDLHEFIEQGVNWPRVVERAENTGASDALAVTLRLLGDLLGTNIDQAILDDLPLRRVSWPKRKLARYVFSLSAERGERFRRHFLRTRKGFELRLVRLADIWAYAFPGSSTARAQPAIRHTISALLRGGKMILEFVWHRVVRGRPAPASP